jgi:hypothetical protein
MAPAWMVGVRVIGVLCMGGLLLVALTGKPLSKTKSCTADPIGPCLIQLVRPLRDGAACESQGARQGRATSECLNRLLFSHTAFARWFD